MAKRPNLPSGGYHFPHAKDNLYQFDPPSTPPARKAFGLPDALGPSLSNRKKNCDESPCKSGPRSGASTERCDGRYGLSCVDEAPQIGLMSCVDELSQQILAGRSRSPTICLSLAPRRRHIEMRSFRLTRSLQTLRYPEKSFLVRVQSENPSGLRGAFRSLRIAIFGRPGGLQMDEGSERKGGIRADFRPSSKEWRRTCGA